MRTFHFAVSLVKATPGMTITSLVSGWRRGPDLTEDAVRGMAVALALKEKPGMAINNVIIGEIKEAGQ